MPGVLTRKSAVAPGSRRSSRPGWSPRPDGCSPCRCRTPRGCTASLPDDGLADDPDCHAVPHGLPQPAHLEHRGEQDVVLRPEEPHRQCARRRRDRGAARAASPAIRAGPLRSATRPRSRTALRGAGAPPRPHRARARQRIGQTEPLPDEPARSGVSLSQRPASQRSRIGARRPRVSARTGQELDAELRSRAPRGCPRTSARPLPEHDVAELVAADLSQAHIEVPAQHVEAEARGIHAEHPCEREAARRGARGGGVPASGSTVPVGHDAPRLS